MMKRSFGVLLLGIFCALNNLYAIQNDTVKYVLTGKFTDKDIFIPHYSSIQMPENAIKISVLQSFKTIDGRDCNIDMGVFDEKGVLFNGKGFRGWSGGARRTFEISESFATPGYIPGKIRAGEWNIVQMLVKNVPEVKWKLEVTIIIGENKENVFVPVYARDSINNRPGWYRIDTHVHTIHSDGEYTPEEVAALAESAGLNGIISTDHNTYSALGYWGNISQDSLLVINGIEVTYIDGHWNVFGLNPASWIDFRFRYWDNKRYQQSVALAKQVGRFTVVNHPYSIEYKYDKSLLDGVEVWNGPWDESDEKAVCYWQNMLASGVYKVAVGGSDYHNKNNQIGFPHMIVKSERLSGNAILQGIAEGTSYIVKDKSISLRMEAYDEENPAIRADIGNYLFAKSSVLFHLSSSVSGNLFLIDQQGICYNRQIKANEPVVFRLMRKSTWIRAELRDMKGNMLALTNPIFIVLPFSW